MGPYFGVGVTVTLFCGTSTDVVFDGVTVMPSALHFIVPLWMFVRATRTSPLAAM